VPTPTPHIVTGSFISLVGKGTQKCNWDGKAQQADIQGTVYVADKRIRTEATTKVSGFSVTGYGVGDGEKMTVWTSYMPAQKFTYSYEDIEKMSREATTSGTKKDSQQAYEQFVKEYNFQCVPWTVDESMFVIPK
jgi:hypothetical protein